MAKLSSTQIYGDLQVDGEIKNKATTETEGVVQLNDAINNDSIVQGATANAVKKVNDSLSSHKTDTTSHITASERTTWNSKAEGTHSHDYLPLGGGTLTGGLAIKTTSAEAIRAISGDYTALMGCSSSTKGDFLFGGKTTSSSSWENYIRLSTNKLIFYTDGKNYNIYHEGNKPTPADIGASPSSHTHTKSQITDFPTSLPANGGNADTVDGKHASDFLPIIGGTLSGGLTVSSLKVSDYGTPFECGKYIDFHESGSSSDYDGRLYISGGSLVFTSASNSSYSMNIPSEINSLKTSVANGKTSVANAINGKLGTQLSNQTSFSSMASYISSIQVANFSMPSSGTIIYSSTTQCVGRVFVVTSYSTSYGTLTISPTPSLVFSVHGGGRTSTTRFVGSGYSCIVIYPQETTVSMSVNSTLSGTTSAFRLV